MNTDRCHRAGARSQKCQLLVLSLWAPLLFGISSILASLIGTQPHTWVWTLHDFQVSTFNILTPASLHALVQWITLGCVSVSGPSSSGWGVVMSHTKQTIIGVENEQVKQEAAARMADHPFNATFNYISWFLHSFLPLLLLFLKHQRVKEWRTDPK